MEKNIITKIIFFLLLFVQIIYADEIDLKSEKYILYNLNDNEILFERDSHEETHVASLTKIMTTIVAIENIDNFDEKVTITYDMLKDIEWDVAVVGFDVGEKLTYDDLLYGTVLSSGADAVNALAISLAGSEENFVKLMNDKVKELGLKNTHFANPIGLYDTKNYSSAYDISQILIYALKNEKFKEVFSTRIYQFSNGKTTKSTIEKYNEKSSNDISYITGSKTGYIKAAGYCLATTATIDNVNYLLVTLNAYNESGAHVTDTVKIYEYYSENYGYKTIVDKNDVVVKLDTICAKEKEIEIYSGIKIEDYLKNDFKKENVTYEYEGVDIVSYFTKKGTKLGNVKIKYNDVTLDEFELIYNQELSFGLFAFLWYYKVYIIILVLFLLLCFRMKKIKKRKKNRSKKS